MLKKVKVGQEGSRRFKKVKHQKILCQQVILLVAVASKFLITLVLLDDKWNKNVTTSQQNEKIDVMCIYFTHKKLVLLLYRYLDTQN